MMVEPMAANWGAPEHKALAELLRLAWPEDLDSAGDITSQALIPSGLGGKAVFIAKQPGIMAGLPILEPVFSSITPAAKVELFTEDGKEVSQGREIATITGPMRAILTGERIALNFLQRLSGIATQTKRFVAEVADTHCQVLDTRKTTPGWRVLEKYAVRCGGGHNHRMGLFDAILIKNNHLAILRQQGIALASAIQQARHVAQAATIVEIEVETAAQLQEVLALCPDWVLLDNMNLDQLRESVRLRNVIAPQVKLEASGGITLATIRNVALTGVDFISAGAITHSAPALDICLHYVN